MFRYKAIIEYNGLMFAGMQTQKNSSSVQSVIEKALSSFLACPTTINFAGRTDAGVHATGQVIDFLSHKPLECQSIVLGMNFYLIKQGVVCITAEKVDIDFHSRFSAKMRHYKYRIVNRISPLTFEVNNALHLRSNVNIDDMMNAGKKFIGTYDFSLFRSSSCQAKSPIRTIHGFHMEVFPYTGHGKEINIYFSAQSFLHNMVRRMVGLLIDVGVGKETVDSVDLFLLPNAKRKVPTTVSPYGLYLIKVDY